MAKTPKDQRDKKPADSKLLTPSQLANRKPAAVDAASLIRDMRDIDDERSGQLSPPHTPGRSR